MVTITKEVDWEEVRDNCWSGARDTAKILDDYGLGDDFMNMIEEMYPDGISEGDLNDILWFEDDWIFETLGINPYGEEDDEDEDNKEED